MKRKIAYENNSEGGDFIDKNDKHEKRLILNSFIKDKTKMDKQFKVNVNNYDIYFPYQPYPQQIVYMQKVIESLEKNGISALESPTGTGKTLCLLCAILGWIETKRSKLIAKRNCGEQISEEEENSIPKVFYSSRTHTQLSGVIKELKKTIYSPKISIMSSRDQLCVNPCSQYIKGNSLNAKCKQLRLKNGCKYSQGVDKMTTSKYDSFGLFDIEEIYNIGLRDNFCPFFLERKKCNSADLVLLPYNYIFENSIRETLKLNLKNAVLVVDEAHNMQGFCEESQSISISVNTLKEVVSELNGAKTLKKESQKGNGKTSVGLLANIRESDIDTEIRIADNIAKYISALKLKKGNAWPNIGLKLSEKELFEVFTKGSQDNSQTRLSISGRNECLTFDNFHAHIVILEQILNSIEVELQKESIIKAYVETLNLVQILAQNYIDCLKNHIKDPLKNYCASYKFFVNEEDYSSDKIKKIIGKKQKDIILNLYCMNPGFGFHELLNQEPKSVIITSGTLSPIKGIESEIQTKLNIQLENDHVINLSQVNLSILHQSYYTHSIPFLFDYKSKSNSQLITDLGNTIIDLISTTKGGVLIFFTSYSYLNFCVDAWEKGRIYEKMYKIKPIFKDLHDNKKNKILLNSYLEKNRDKTSNGAILMSVFRGTTSEGIDFSDDLARMVICIGIPYPNLGDPKVQLKKEFLTEFQRNINTNRPKNYIEPLSEKAWYTQAAARAINQAIGRVIRHINDYGSIVLIDTRYKDMVSNGYISKWLRNVAIDFYDKKIINNLNSFFSRMKNYVPKPPLYEIKPIKNDSSFVVFQKKNEYQNKKEALLKSKEKVNNENLKIMEAKLNPLNIQQNFKSNVFNTTSFNSGITNINGRFVQDKNQNNNQNNNTNNRINTNDKPISVNINTQINIQPMNLNNTPFDDNDCFFLLPDTERKDPQRSKNQNKAATDANLLKAFENLDPKQNNKDTYNQSLDKHNLKIEPEGKKSEKESEIKAEKKSETKKDDDDDDIFGGDNIMTCKLCFNSSKSDENIEFLAGKCGHICCSNCWNNWLDQHKRCPFCKKKTHKKDLTKLFYN